MLQVFGHHQNAFAWKEHEMFADDLLRPERLWTRHEVLTRPSPVPREPGIYAWVSRGLGVVPSSSCTSCGRATIALHWFLAIGPTDQRKGSEHSIITSSDSLSLHTQRAPRSDFRSAACWPKSWKIGRAH